MKFRSLCVCLALMGLLVSACASEPEPVVEAEPEAVAEPEASDDPLSGTWTGDWGPSPNDRNAVTLELAWDGTALTGTVNPGPDAVPLTAASFDPATNTVRMEADAETFQGPAHYMIEGTVDGGTISGSWGHDDVSGDFTLTMDGQ
jgi:hypothetical protein